MGPPRRPGVVPMAFEFHLPDLAEAYQEEVVAEGEGGTRSR